MAALTLSSVTGGAVTNGTQQMVPVGVLGKDGANFQPAGDAVGREFFNRISDGSNALSLVNGTALPVASQAVPTGGATPYSYVGAGSTNQDSQVVKSSAGTLYSLSVSSTIATIRWVKVYDKSTAPTSGDTPKFRIPVPAAAAGTVASLHLPPCGVVFSNGIAIRMTTGIADNDANPVTANDCLVNLSYS